MSSNCDHLQRDLLLGYVESRAHHRSAEQLVKCWLRLESGWSGCGAAARKGRAWVGRPRLEMPVPTWSLVSDARFHFAVLSLQRCCHLLVFMSFWFPV